MVLCQSKDMDWDAAVEQGCDIYSHRMHNICCDNCHSHVVQCLNLMAHDGKKSYNMVQLAAWFFFNGNSQEAIQSNHILPIKFPVNLPVKSHTPNLISCQLSQSNHTYAIKPLYHRLVSFFFSFVISTGSFVSNCSMMITFVPFLLLVAVIVLATTLTAA